MARIYPRLSVEVVIIFASFNEKSIIQIDHPLSYKRVPFFSNSSTIARLLPPILINKFYVKAVFPKIIRFIPQVLKSRLKYPFLPLSKDLLIPIIVDFISSLLYLELEDGCFHLQSH